MSPPRLGSAPGYLRWFGGVALLVGLGILAVDEPGVTVLGGAAALMIVALFTTPKVAVSGIALFLLFQPFFVNLGGGTDTSFGLALQRVDQVVLVASMFRVVLFLGWRRLREPLTSWTWYVVAFVLAGLFSSFIARGSLVVTGLGAVLALKFPVFFLLSLTIDWNERDAGRLIRGLLILTPVLLALGVFLLILPPEATRLFLDSSAEVEGFFARGEIRSMQGPFAHPGFFGWAMAVGGCVAIAQAMRRPTSQTAIALLGSVIGMVASLRRKPLVALPVAALSAVLAAGTKRQRFGVVLLVAVMSIGAIGFGGARLRAIREDTIANYVDPYVPAAARTLLYFAGLDIAREHFPLGAGFGRFGGYASQLYYSPLYDQYGLSSVYGLSRDFPIYIADTYWPHILGETGVVGTLILATFMLRIWISCIKTARRPIGEPTRVLAVAAAMILVEALIESAVSPIFDSALQAYAIAFPLGITLVLGARARQQPRLAGAAALPPSGRVRS